MRILGVAGLFATACVAQSASRWRSPPRGCEYMDLGSPAPAAKAALLAQFCEVWREKTRELLSPSRLGTATETINPY